jgi:hypothetical protein
VNRGQFDEPLFQPSLTDDFATNYGFRWRRSPAMNDDFAGGPVFEAKWTPAWRGQFHPRSHLPYKNLAAICFIPALISSENALSPSRWPKVGRTIRSPINVFK